jgi:hypothetical protein
MKKEMWVVIDVVVWTNHITLKYFATQPKLSSKQVRWQDTLALFNVDIQHKPRKGKLKDVLLKECHDGPLAGNGGAKCT